MARAIDNERRACDAVARSLEALFNSKRINPRCPETIGEIAPIDYAFELVGDTYALEHTIIEAFERQIHTGVDFAAFIAPIEAALDHHVPLPGKYTLVFPIDPSAGLKKSEISQAQKIIVSWIRTKAAELHAECPSQPTRALKPNGHQSWRQEAIAELGFALRLDRETGWWMPDKAKGRLFITRYAPKNYEDLRRERLEVTLSKKLPKLKKWKAAGAKSLLVLENGDLSLTNHVVVAQAIEERLQDRSDKPDEIWFVDTVIENEWTAIRLMSNGQWFPDDNEPIPCRHFKPDDLIAV